MIHTILYGSCHMYNISSIKENGEMMLKVTPESHFANLVVQNCFFLFV